MKKYKLNKPLTLLLMSVINASAISAADYLSEGRDAFLNYDFDLASELYAKYAKSLKTRPDEQGAQLLENFQRQLDIAESSLDNVQKVELIDRLDVPMQDFLDYILLPGDGNRLLPKESIPLKERFNTSDYVFSSPSGELMMWTESDDDGVSHIFESSRLVDGSWESPRISGKILNDGGDVKNPYMLTDGVTVYFAGDGDGTMGGYDIFVAAKDAATGEYLQPTGVGYPFNSPANEYMMAIDEENGIGWWVTDRNQLENQVSVYVFFTNDVRKNYIADDEEDIVALAKVEDISLTQNPDKDYDRISQEIKARNSQRVSEEDPGFDFHVPGGRVIRTLSDLSSSNSKRLMSQYLDAMEEFKSNQNRLSELRKKYRSASAGGAAPMSLKNQIMDLEKAIDMQRDKLKKMRNAIISSL